MPVGYCARFTMSAQFRENEMERKVGAKRSAKKVASPSDGSQRDAIILNALVDSLHTIFETMMNTKVEMGAPIPKPANTVQSGVSALIGMNAHQARGSVAITLPMPALNEISRKLLGEEVTAIDMDAAGLAGELSNMLAGVAKRILSEQGMEFDMQTPQMMHGDGHEIEHHHDGQTMLLPVNMNGHEFFIELNFV
ncbi:MAG: chemotaxis protein CheX [Sideroxydans sp.]|nr:chemotaxis protein CheX [Sideroxydans sp.]